MVAWWHSQHKLFTDKDQMQQMTEQSPEFILSKAGHSDIL